MTARAEQGGDRRGGQRRGNERGTEEIERLQGTAGGWGGGGLRWGSPGGQAPAGRTASLSLPARWPALPAHMGHDGRHECQWTAANDQMCEKLRDVHSCCCRLS